MILALILILSSPLAQASSHDAYARGVEASRAGDHAAAIEAFTDALDQGGQDSAVYHGLGNSLYREGRLGPAIAAWKRGLVLSPRDGDLAANLDRARRQARDRIEPPDPGLGPFFWQRWLSPRDSALASGLLFFVATLGLFLREYRRRRKPGARAWGAETILGLAGGLLLTLSTAAAGRAADGAVIILPEVSVRSALGPDGLELFILHEGAEIRVVEEAGEHILIALPDERKGWVPEDALLTTDPAAPFSH